MTADRLELRVRLADQRGDLDVYEPATGVSVSYRHDFDAKARTIRLHYRSTHSRPGRIAVLLPLGMRVRQVLLDDRRQPSAPERVGEDRYVSVATDWTSHRLEIHLVPLPRAAPSARP